MLSLPQDVKKDIRKLPGAGVRLLVWLLLLAICTISTAYYRTTRERLNECENRGNRQDITIEKLNQKIDSLKMADFIKTETENVRLKNRVAWQDSIKQVLQSIIDRQR